MPMNNASYQTTSLDRAPTTQTKESENVACPCSKYTQYIPHSATQTNRCTTLTNLTPQLRKMVTEWYVSCLITASTTRQN
jgi:hypothetical protein